MEISEIKQRLSMATVLQYYNLKPDKHNRISCPFHEDKTPSMQVYYKTQTAYCFSSNCKTHGKSLDVIDFIMHKENQDKHNAILKAAGMLNGHTVPAATAQAVSKADILTKMFTYFKNAVHNGYSGDIDPNGMKIAGDTVAVNNIENHARRNVAYEQERQRRMQARADRRAANGKSTNGLNRRIARSEFREGQYQSTFNEIGAMRSSSTIYNVSTNYSSAYSDGNTEYAGTDADGNYIININVSQSYLKEGGLAHELVHGYQFETGQIDFQSNGSPGLLYDITDEVSAFKRQFAFTNDSRMYGLTPVYIRGITNKDGTSIYTKLPSGPLNINSTRAEIELHHTGKCILLYNAPYKSINLDYTPIYK